MEQICLKILVSVKLNPEDYLGTRKIEKLDAEAQVKEIVLEDGNSLLRVARDAKKRRFYGAECPNGTNITNAKTGLPYWEVYFFDSAEERDNWVRHENRDRDPEEPGFRTKVLRKKLSAWALRNCTYVADPQK